MKKRNNSRENQLQKAAVRGLPKPSKPIVFHDVSFPPNASSSQMETDSIDRQSPILREESDDSIEKVCDD